SLVIIVGLAMSGSSAQLGPGPALAGGILQAMSHATAKAAMFMAAGLMYTALGHDRIAGLGGIGRARPLSVLAFALGGVALVGPAPGGAYFAEGVLFRGAGPAGQWGVALVMQAGGHFSPPPPRP